VDRLVDRVWCGAEVFTADGDSVLERGVRGKKDKRENAREVTSILGEDEAAGELERKLRLRVRKEGVRECLEDLWVRRGKGVTGT
jgi:hypothetical protein